MLNFIKAAIVTLILLHCKKNKIKYCPKIKSETIDEILSMCDTS